MRRVRTDGRRARLGWACACLSLLLPSLAAGEARGQERVVPAAAAVDASRLLLGRDSLAIYMVRGGDTIRTGTVRDELGVVGAGGGARLVRIYRSQDNLLGPRLDTIIDRFPGMTPVRHSSRTPRGDEILDYSGGAVRGFRRIPNGDSVAVEAAVQAPAFNAASFDLLLRASPLAEGWSARFPAILASGQTVVLTARVAGAEPVGGEDCWRVDADFAGSAVSFWIGKDTRRLRRQLLQVGPGTQILFGAFPSPPPIPSRAA